jgi:hemoglobin
VPVSLYEFAGGDDAFLALATAHHARCLADPELNHPFSHPGQHPQHVQRLAWYWAEVMGGPPRYSTMCADESAMLRMHAGQGSMGDLGQRFVRCFDQAMDDAKLPHDPRFRATMHDYMEWAVRRAVGHPCDPADVPADLPVPNWYWDGRGSIGDN